MYCLLRLEVRGARGGQETRKSSVQHGGQGNVARLLTHLGVSFRFVGVALQGEAPICALYLCHTHEETGRNEEDRRESSSNTFGFSFEERRRRRQERRGKGR